jgi:hypothetical protein
MALCVCVAELSWISRPGTLFNALALLSLADRASQVLPGDEQLVRVLATTIVVNYIKEDSPVRCCLS